MNEPQHPHFVLSDARYCHVLQQGLVISNKKTVTEIPAQNDNPDYVSSIWLILGIAVISFLITMCAITGMWVVVFLLGLIDGLMIVTLYRMLGFSQSAFIPRDDVTGVEYFKRNFGYDWFLVHYTGKNGKHCKRRLVIYDSAECLNQALTVMKAENFLK